MGQLKIIFCDDDTCIHNVDGIVCKRSQINLKKEFSNNYENGKFQCYVACQDYEVKEDGTD